MPRDQGASPLEKAYDDGDNGTQEETGERLEAQFGEENMFADEREVKTVLPAVHRGGKREYTGTFEVKERQELMLQVELDQRLRARA